MLNLISILYANRNRDATRIRKSFESLQQQKLQNFEVIFVDFGSEKKIVHELEAVVQKFVFLRFFHLDVSHVLWNKSKALNYGIKRANGDYIFIADTDLVFHPEATFLFQKLQDTKKFHLFKLGYLSKRDSGKLTEYKFDELRPSRFGEVNGMILTSRESLVKVNGLDEFFHFYGAEDEDLFGRLENAGYKRTRAEEKYFHHIWHESFSGSEDRIFTGNPRVKNIMRINQRHFERNRDRGIIKPLRQEGMGSLISPEKAAVLKKPDIKLEIPNILARVEHFLNEELQSRKGEVIRAVFFEDDYYNSPKYKMKLRLGKQTQQYISMKKVNDMILKEILFNYRDHNYSFRIDENLKSIVFCLEV